MVAVGNPFFLVFQGAVGCKANLDVCRRQRYPCRRRQPEDQPLIRKHFLRPATPQTSPRASTYSLTRRLGSPSPNRSEMTATEAAPAAITAGAVANVMPPIATTGRIPAAALFDDRRNPGARSRSVGRHGEK